MIKVKSYFHTVLKSLVPQHEYYKSLLRTSFSSAFVYLTLLLICINSITVVFFLTKLHPVELKGLLTSVEKNLQSYPQDQVIMLHNGKLFSNANSPYFLWTNYQNNKNLLLVVDKTADPAKINEYNSAVLITSNKLVLRDIQSSSSYKVLSLNVVNSQTVNAETIKEVRMTLLRIIQNYNLYLILFVIGALIVLPMISLLTTLFYLLIASVISFLAYFIFVKKANNVSMKHVKFWKVFQLGLQAATLPLLLDYGLNLLGLTSRPLPFLFFVLLTVFVFGGMYEAYYIAPVHTTHHPKHKKS